MIDDEELVSHKARKVEAGILHARSWHFTFTPIVNIESLGQHRKYNKSFPMAKVRDNVRLENRHYFLSIAPCDSSIFQVPQIVDM